MGLPLLGCSFAREVDGPDGAVVELVEAFKGGAVGSILVLGKDSGDGVGGVFEEPFVCGDGSDGYGSRSGISADGLRTYGEKVLRRGVADVQEGAVGVVDWA